VALSTHKAHPDLSKLDPLDGTNNRCWSQKLPIFFEQLEVDYVLFFDHTEENNTSETTAASGDAIVKDKSKIVDAEMMKKFQKDNRMVTGHLLNHLTKPLFDLFVTFKSNTIVWEKLVVKYGADDAGKRNYVVGEWLRFQVLMTRQP